MPNNSQIKESDSSRTDLKSRWGGILENPYISKVHRHCLDGFKVGGLAKIIKSLEYKNILDVGCGIGEYSTMKKGRFVGLDNSLPRVKFAQRYYKHGLFLLAEATKLPFKDHSFEAVLLANTIHHLSDESLTEGVLEMKRVSRKYIILDDAVRWSDQNRLSQFFYSMDRGTMFRTTEEIEAILKRIEDLKVVLKGNFWTFPRLYYHTVIVLEVGDLRF